jgi:hypothetical protein
MATFTKINDFVLHLNEGEHRMDSDQLVLALSNTLPSTETSDPSADGNGLLANVTQIAYTNLSTRNLTLNSSSQTGGTYTLSLNDITLSASGGAVAAFQYIYIYNSAAAVLTNPLIGYYDYGSSLTLQDGESLTVDFGADGPTTGALYTMT